jgi:nucleoside-diphosphate-sugar epimerase
MELKDKNILVTGATGFIGGHLTERLARAEGATVTALSRSADKLAALESVGARLVKGDVTNPAAVRRAIEGCQIVFHCAGLMHDGAADLEKFRHVNVEGTRQVLHAAVEAGVERVVHLSSIAVYGISPRDGTNERDPHRPCGMPYFDSKIEAEQVVQSMFEQKGLPLVIIRPANVYGPRSSFWTVGLLTMIKAGNITLIDEGRGMSNHLYVDNLVDAMVLAAGNDSVVGEGFIVTDDLRTTWNEFLNYYARMLGRGALGSMGKARAYLTATWMQMVAWITGHPPSLTYEAIRLWTQSASFDIAATRSKLGYIPRVGLEQGMSHTEQWLRESGYLD